VYRDEEGVKEKQLLALEDGCMRERRRKVDECKKVENIGSINGGTVQNPATQEHSRTGFIALSLFVVKHLLEMFRKVIGTIS
jgi:hypothetical protein